MSTPRILGVIPARLGSTRLPRKPLYPLAGRPLIEWVWRRVAGMKLFAGVVVATDSEEVAAVCRAMGAAVEMTAASHASGTDRVAEVASRPAYAGYDVIVNVQGDEPFIEEEPVAEAAPRDRRMADRDGGHADSNARGVARSRSRQGRSQGRRRALYFSCAPIPFCRDRADASGAGVGRYLRHLGVYAYSPAALARLVSLLRPSSRRSKGWNSFAPWPPGSRSAWPWCGGGRREWIRSRTRAGRKHGYWLRHNEQHWQSRHRMTDDPSTDQVHS